MEGLQTGEMTVEEVCEAAATHLHHPAGPSSFSRSLDSTTAAGKNLSNLQSCLATLKSEMALLQSRLAPPAPVPLTGGGGPDATTPTSTPEKISIITP